MKESFRIPHSAFRIGESRSPSTNSARPDFLCVIVLAAIALALRLTGITWALPSELHRFTYHPDELLVIGAALTLITPPISLNPHFYNYGSFYIYLTALATLAASAWTGFADQTALLRTMYLGARLIGAIFGSATVIAAFAAGTRYRNRAVGLLAASILAIAPLHVQHSHFATVDVTATFWATLAVLYGLKLASGGRISECVAGGFFAGLAAGTKYNAALMLLPVVAGAMLGSDRLLSARAVRRVGFCAAGALAGFFVGTPGAFIWPREFLRGFLYEIEHSRSGHGFVFADTGPGWLYHLRSTLWYGLGLPLTALATIGLGLACGRLRGRTKGAIVLLAAFVPYYAWGALSQVRFARYLLPIFPILAIFAADAIVSIYGGVRERKRYLAWCWAGVCFAAVLGTLLYTLALGRLFVIEDPRDQAIAWMKSHILAGSSIAFPTAPWFYSPPVTPETTALSAAEHYEALSKSQDRWRLLANPDLEFDVSLLDARPDFVVVSDYEVEGRLRVQNAQAVAFMRHLRSVYGLSHVFANDVRIGPVKFCSAEKLPHDMRYVSPTIYVYSIRR